MHHANVTLCRYCLTLIFTTTTITIALRDTTTTTTTTITVITNTTTTITTSTTATTTRLLLLLLLLLLIFYCFFFFFFSLIAMIRDLSNVVGHENSYVVIGSFWTNLRIKFKFWSSLRRIMDSFLDNHFFLFQVGNIRYMQKTVGCYFTAYGPLWVI